MTAKTAIMVAGIAFGLLTTGGCSHLKPPGEMAVLKDADHIHEFNAAYQEHLRQKEEARKSSNEFKFGWINALLGQKTAPQESEKTVLDVRDRNGFLILPRDPSD